MPVEEKEVNNKLSKGIRMLTSTNECGRHIVKATEAVGEMCARNLSIAVYFHSIKSSFYV